MNKRGQIFIFAAIVVGLVTFVLFTKPNTMHEEVLLENFGEISENYLNEAPKVVDHSIYNEYLVEDKLEEYTSDFLNYARGELDPNVGIVYAYSNESNIIVDNQLNGDMIYLQPTGQQGQLLFSSNTKLGGELILDGTGITDTTETGLCILDQSILSSEQKLPYCKMKLGNLNEVTLKIGDIEYPFTIKTKNPGVFVIIKSTDGDTTKVDKFQTEI